MAIEITIAVSFPETLEISIPVEMHNIGLSFAEALRLPAPAGTTQTVYTDEETGDTLRIDHSDGSTVVRTDLFLYDEKYTREMRMLKATGEVLIIRKENASGKVEILSQDDLLTLQQIRDIIRMWPEDDVLPIGFEVTIPWTAENGVEYENTLALMGYADLIAEEDAEEETETRMAVFRSKYATVAELPYSRNWLHLRTSDTTADGNSYYYGVQQSYNSQTHTYSYNVTALGRPTRGATISRTGYSYVVKTTFNAAATATISGGYAYWPDAIWRNYLNSDALAGEWYLENYSETGNTKIQALQGYMAGFAAEDLACMRKVKVSTAYKPRNSTSSAVTMADTFDTFWLPASVDMYYVPENEGEGQAWDDYWHAMGISEPGTGGGAAKRAYRMDARGTPAQVMLRSADTTGSNRVKSVLTGGTQSNVIANTLLRGTPMCAIG